MQRKNSMNYSDSNQGQIWPNDRKVNDTQPDFKGSLNIKGEEFWISAWKRKGGENSKTPSISISVQPKNRAIKRQAKDYVVVSENSTGAWD